MMLSVGLSGRVFPMFPVCVSSRQLGHNSQSLVGTINARFHALQNPSARPPALVPPARQALVAYLGVFALVCYIGCIFRLHFWVFALVSYFGCIFRLHFWCISWFSCIFYIFSTIWLIWERVKFSSSTWRAVQLGSSRVDSVESTLLSSQAVSQGMALIGPPNVGSTEAIFLVLWMSRLRWEPELAK